MRGSVSLRFRDDETERDSSSSSSSSSSNSNRRRQQPKTAKTITWNWATTTVTKPTATTKPTTTKPTTEGGSPGVSQHKMERMRRWTRRLVRQDASSKGGSGGSKGGNVVPANLDSAAMNASLSTNVSGTPSTTTTDFGTIRANAERSGLSPTGRPQYLVAPPPQQSQSQSQQSQLQPPRQPQQKQQQQQQQQPPSTAPSAGSSSPPRFQHSHEAAQWRPPHPPSRSKRDSVLISAAPPEEVAARRHTVDFELSRRHTADLVLVPRVAQTSYVVVPSVGSSQSSTSSSDAHFFHPNVPPPDESAQPAPFSPDSIGESFAPRRLRASTTKPPPPPSHTEVLHDLSLVEGGALLVKDGVKPLPPPKPSPPKSTAPNPAPQSVPQSTSQSIPQPTPQPIPQSTQSVPQPTSQSVSESLSQLLPLQKAPPPVVLRRTGDGPGPSHRQSMILVRPEHQNAIEDERRKRRSMSVSKTPTPFIMPLPIINTPPEGEGNSRRIMDVLKPQRPEVLRNLISEGRRSEDTAWRQLKGPWGRQAKNQWSDAPSSPPLAPSSTLNTPLLPVKSASLDITNRPRIVGEHMKPIPITKRDVVRGKLFGRRNEQSPAVTPTPPVEAPAPEPSPKPRANRLTTDMEAQVRNNRRPPVTLEHDPLRAHPPDIMPAFLARPVREPHANRVSREMRRSMMGKGVVGLGIMVGGEEVDGVDEEGRIEVVVEEDVEMEKIEGHEEWIKGQFTDDVYEEALEEVVEEVDLDTNGFNKVDSKDSKEDAKEDKEDIKNDSKEDSKDFKNAIPTRSASTASIPRKPVPPSATVDALEYRPPPESATSSVVSSAMSAATSATTATGGVSIILSEDDEAEACAEMKRRKRMSTIYDDSPVLDAVGLDENMPEKADKLAPVAKWDGRRAPGSRRPLGEVSVNVNRMSLAPHLSLLPGAGDFMDLRALLETSFDPASSGVSVDGGGVMVGGNDKKGLIHDEENNVVEVEEDKAEIAENKVEIAEDKEKVVGKKLHMPPTSPSSPSPERPPSTDEHGRSRLDYNRFSAQRDAVELNPANLASIMVHETRRLRLINPPRQLSTPTEEFLMASPAPRARYLDAIPFRPLGEGEIRLVTILPPQASTRVNPPFPASNPLAFNSAHLHLELEHVALSSVAHNDESGLHPRTRMPVPPGGARVGDVKQLRAAELAYRMQSYNWMSEQRRAALHARMLEMGRTLDATFAHRRDKTRSFEEARDYLGSYVYTPLDNDRLVHTDAEFIVLSYPRETDDNTPEAALRPVVINGHEVLIPPRLESALRTLREMPDVEYGARVWVETLCVDTTDTAETSVDAQRVTGEILQASRHVVSWVAPDDAAVDPVTMSDTDLAIDFVAECCRRLGTDGRGLKRALQKWLCRADVVKSTLYRALSRFYSRGYWRRACTLRDVARGGLVRGWTVYGRRVVATRDIAAWAGIVHSILAEDGLTDERKTLYRAVQSARAAAVLDSLDWTAMATWDRATTLKAAVFTTDLVGAQEAASAQDLVAAQLALLPPSILGYMPPMASTTAPTPTPLAHAASLGYAIARGASCPDWITDVAFRWRWPSWVRRPGDRRGARFVSRQTYCAGGTEFPAVFEPVADGVPRLELDVEGICIGKVIQSGAYGYGALPLNSKTASWPPLPRISHRYGNLAGLSTAVRASLNARNADPRALTFLDIPFRESIADVLSRSSTHAHLATDEAVIELADRVTVAAASLAWWNVGARRLDALLAMTSPTRPQEPGPEDAARLASAWKEGKLDDGLPTLFMLDSGHVGSIDLGRVLEESDVGNDDVDVAILPGMEVWVLVGCAWPVVLWGEGRRRRCLGRAYVHGAMAGEVLEGREREVVRLV